MRPFPVWSFFILKNHFKVLAPIGDGEIPSGFQRRFLQGMSADLQGDFRMWSFHMYLPKLSMENVHLVRKLLDPPVFLWRERMNVAAEMFLSLQMSSTGG